MACGFGNPRHSRLGSLRYFGCGSAALRCIAELHSAASWQVPVRSSFPTLYRLQIGDTADNKSALRSQAAPRHIHPAAAYPNAEMLRFLFQRAQLIVPSPAALAVVLTRDFNRVSRYAQPYRCNQRKGLPSRRALSPWRGRKDVRVLTPCPSRFQSAPPCDLFLKSCDHPTRSYRPTRANDSPSPWGRGPG
jgi:hypothetical protein